VGTGAVQWSEELHRIHGLDPARFAGNLEAHLEPIHPDDRSRVRAAMQTALSQPHPFETEYRIIRPDGEERRLFARAEVALAVSDSVAVAGLRGICQDITERARSAAIRHAKEGAERASRAEGEALARTARQVGGPLRDILDLASELEQSGLGKEQAEAVGGILRAAETGLAALAPSERQTDPLHHPPTVADSLG
jgi:PAS domain S-box-containing protein